MIKSQKSFTLIEILIVIGIIIILAGISIPMFRNYQPTLQLNGAVRNLISDLRYAQQLAVTEQDEYCVRFFPSEKKYQIIQCQDPEAEEILETISFKGIDSITADFSHNEARYNPYGAVTEAGNITLTNIEGKEKIIEVKPSGFVKTSE